MKLAQQDAHPWYRERWPWLLMAGPAAVVVAGVITTTLAIRSSDGLVADDYYKQGLAVNQQLARDHKAQDLGVQAEILWSGKQVRVLLGGKDAGGEGLVLRIVHPTRAGEDQQVTLHGEGGGVFTGTLGRELEAGRWNILLEDKAGQWRLQGVLRAGSDVALRLQAPPLQSTPKP